MILYVDIPDLGDYSTMPLRGGDVIHPAIGNVGSVTHVAFHGRGDGTVRATIEISDDKIAQALREEHGTF